MAFINKNRYRGDYTALYHKKIIETNRFSLTYLGKGQFLYSLNIGRGLHFRRFDLFTRRKIFSTGALFATFLAFNLFSLNSANSQDPTGEPDNAEKAQYGFDIEKAEKTDVESLSKEEAINLGDDIRKKIMGETQDDWEKDEARFVREEAPQGKSTGETGSVLDTLTRQDLVAEGESTMDLRSEVDTAKKSKFSPFVYNVYPVRKNDTIASVAKKFGIRKESLAYANRLSLYDWLTPGKKLRIPNQDGYTIKVKHGQSLAALVQKYKIKYDKFIAVNDLENLDRVQPGEVLFLPDLKAPVKTEGWLLPTRRRVVTSRFGWRKYPRKAFHAGLDLRARYERVRAVRSGKVIYAGWMGAYGKCVVIKHWGGYKTLYAHNSRIRVYRGQRVKIGQTIAVSGNTGYSTGPHVHLEITRYGKHLNPARFFKGLRYR